MISFNNFDIINSPVHMINAPSDRIILYSMNRVNKGHRLTYALNGLYPLSKAFHVHDLTT